MPYIKNGILDLEEVRAAVGTEYDCNMTWAAEKAKKIPCAFCGRGVAVKSSTPFLHFHGDGWIEADTLVANGNLYPIGPDCLRRMRKLLGDALDHFLAHPGKNS